MRNQYFNEISCLLTKHKTYNRENRKNYDRTKNHISYFKVFTANNSCFSLNYVEKLENVLHIPYFLVGKDDYSAWAACLFIPFWRQMKSNVVDVRRRRLDDVEKKFCSLTSRVCVHKINRAISTIMCGKKSCCWWS